MTKNILFKNIWIFLFLILLVLLFLDVSMIFNSVVIEDVSPVNEFDEKSYMGDWYELARYPNRFEDGCLCAKAQYELKDNYVFVNNTCYKENTASDIQGKAFLTKETGVLKVQFFPIIKSDYRVLYVDEFYTQAIVSDNKAKNLWILVRNPNTMNADYLTNIIKEKGFDETKLIFNDMTYCN